MSDDRRVVVVGSGPPGATSATFLASAGIEVTLLEAGPEQSAGGLTARIGGVTVAKFGRPLSQRADGVVKPDDPRAELFEDQSPGGLTNHWSCAVPRFSPEDFADAERAGEAYAWPIGYEDLRPWYERVEPLLRIAGAPADVPHVPAGLVRHRWALGHSWDAVASAAREDGRSVIPVPYAYGAETTLTRSGTVFNSFVRLVRPAMRRGRLKVRFGARVLRLEWSADLQRVTGVVYRDASTGAEERIPCSAVVLAAGAIETARILLESSSVEFPAGLGNLEGVLGSYLHDHPLGKVAVDLPSPLGMRPPAYLSRPPLEKSPPLLAAAFMQWTGVGMLARSALQGHPRRLRWVGFNVFGTMAPLRENRVALDPGVRRADGASGLQLRIHHPAEAHRVLEESRAWLLDVLGRTGYPAAPRFWEISPPGRSCHFGGTCRMHASPRFGMLDRWNRLHAVPSVLVTDSSSFTTGPEKNPVLTAMALSARAADQLARSLRGAPA